MSSHRLAIEMGRWHKPNKIPIHERKCKFCYNLEDEFHFILECPMYKDLRLKYIHKYFWKRPNIPKFIELCTSRNHKTIKNLSVYVFKCFELRDNFVFV